MSAASSTRLGDLPPPPAGKTGWPWTEESPALPERMPGGAEWPRLSIVTPSFNQGRYLEETLRSVLLQNYPNLEYIVIDGASADGSVETLRRYESRLDFVVSEPASGHADALNKGMARATGSILAFINSDDFYLPGAFAAAARAFSAPEPADLVYGECLLVDQAGREFIEHFGDISRLDEMLDFWGVWRANREIVQPEAFWRRSIAEKIGPFHPVAGSSFVYEYWCRLLIAGAVFRRLDQPLACFRFHPAQRSQTEPDRAPEEYLDLAARWLWDKSVPLPARRRHELQGEWLYSRKYGPAVLAAGRRGDPRWKRWAGSLALCARHPQILSSRAFRERYRNLLDRSTLRRWFGKPNDPR